MTIESDEGRSVAAGHWDDSEVLRAEVLRLHALEAIVREHIDHRELASHLLEWLDRHKDGYD